MSAGVIGERQAAAGAGLGAGRGPGGGADRLAGAGRAAVVAALGVGIYLAALDISVVNAVLPVVADEFGADLATIQWVATVYLLVQSVLLLAVGRLGDMWGHKRLYLWGLTVFVLASVGCALATSTPSLVGGRCRPSGPRCSSPTWRRS